MFLLKYHHFQSQNRSGDYRTNIALFIRFLFFSAKIIYSRFLRKEDESGSQFGQYPNRMFLVETGIFNHIHGNIRTSVGGWLLQSFATFENKNETNEYLIWLSCKVWYYEKCMNHTFNSICTLWHWKFLCQSWI